MADPNRKQPLSTYIYRRRQRLLPNDPNPFLPAPAGYRLPSRIVVGSQIVPLSSPIDGALIPLYEGTLIGNHHTGYQVQYDLIRTYCSTSNKAYADYQDDGGGASSGGAGGGGDLHGPMMVPYYQGHVVGDHRYSVEIHYHLIGRYPCPYAGYYQDGGGHGEPHGGGGGGPHPFSFPKEEEKEEEERGESPKKKRTRSDIAPPTEEIRKSVKEEKIYIIE